jgi:hypothetical protein
MYLKNSLLIVALGMFILASTTAIATTNETNLSHIGSINFTDKVVNVLDHTSNPDEGNWITMESPYERGRIQLPSPMNLT